jgi:hypothetical protein
VGVTCLPHLTDMKRVLVSFVMAIVLAGSGLPLTASALTPSAHACCRAQGAHHCAESARDDNEVAFTAACPYHASAISERRAGAVLALFLSTPDSAKFHRRSS